MREQGIPLEIPDDDEGTYSRPAPKLSVTQDGYCLMDDCFCYTRYIIDLLIVHTFSLPFQLSSVDLELPWGIEAIEWLSKPDPKKRGYYKFAREDGEMFESDATINGFVGTGRHIRRADPLSGHLLGIGKRLPANVSAGTIAAFLHIYDQLGAHYSADIAFIFSRSPSSISRAQSRKLRRPLFEYPGEFEEEAVVKSSRDCEHAATK